MAAIVLAGGLGTRIRELSGTVPKALLPIAGRPFLEYLVRYLRQAGVRRIVLAVGFRADAVAAHFGSGAALGVEIAYSEEESLLGTGGAIRQACQHVERWPVLVLNGDSFVAADYASMLAVHQARGVAATIGLAHVPDSGRFGRAELDADGMLKGFSEKGATGPGLVNAGVYLLEERALQCIPAGPSSFEREGLPALVAQGACGVVAPGGFVDIGIPDDYQRLANEPSLLLRAVGPGAP